MTPIMNFENEKDISKIDEFSMNKAYEIIIQNRNLRLMLDKGLTIKQALNAIYGRGQINE